MSQGFQRQIVVPIEEYAIVGSLEGASPKAFRELKILSKTNLTYPNLSNLSLN